MRRNDLKLAGMMALFLAISPGGWAQSKDTCDSKFVANNEASQFDYGTCPSPEEVCGYYHGGLAVPTNHCVGFDCFQMTYFEQARTVAADDEGLFPRTFMVWLNDPAQTVYTAWADYPCVVERSGRKFKISIPEGLPICGAGMMTPEAVYYWHLGSDPVSGCMGIGECKQSLIYTPADLPPAEQR